MCGGAHDVPRNVKSASLEQFVPPWTVRRQVWSDSLKQRHSGISMDMLLFSDINLSLIHHYRIHKCGLPHNAFRRNYMSRLRAFCLHRWLSLRIVCYRQFRPALDRYVRLSWWESRPEGPDGPSDICGRYVLWRDRLVTFWSSRFRILQMYRGRWSTTVASVAPCVIAAK